MTIYLSLLNPKVLIEFEWLLKTQWNHKWSQNSTRSSFFHLQLTLHALYGNSKQLATNKQTKIKFSCGKHVKPTLLSIHAVFKSASVFHGHRKGSDKEPKRDRQGTEEKKIRDRKGSTRDLKRTDKRSKREEYGKNTGRPRIEYKKKTTVRGGKNTGRIREGHGSNTNRRLQSEEGRIREGHGSNTKRRLQSEEGRIREEYGKATDRIQKEDYSPHDEERFLHDLVLSIAKPIQPHIHMLSLSRFSHAHTCFPYLDSATHKHKQAMYKHKKLDTSVLVNEDTNMQYE